MRTLPVVTAIITLILTALPSLSAEGVASGTESVFWTRMEKSLGISLPPSGPNIQNFFMETEVLVGNSLLASGVAGFVRGGSTWFAIFSRSSSCIFYFDGATATCRLDTPSSKVFFRGGHGESVPVPVLRISRGQEEGYQFDIAMTYRLFSATQPIMLGTDPGLPEYLAQRLQTKFPKFLEASDTIYLTASGSASPSVVLSTRDGRITGFSAFFPADNGPDFVLRIPRIIATGPIPLPPVEWTRFEGTPPATKLEAVWAFCRGFYDVLSEMVPK